MQNLEVSALYAHRLPRHNQGGGSMGGRGGQRNLSYDSRAALGAAPTESNDTEAVNGAWRTAGERNVGGNRRTAHQNHFVGAGPRPARTLIELVSFGRFYR